MRTHQRGLGEGMSPIWPHVSRHYIHIIGAEHARIIYTSIRGSLPFNATLIFVLVNTTSRSLPRISAGTGIVTSASAIVCVHLYGRVACSFASFSLCSRSRRSRSAREGSVSVSGCEDIIASIL